MMKRGVMLGAEIAAENSDSLDAMIRERAAELEYLEN
jgi:hypothetical protein